MKNFAMKMTRLLLPGALAFCLIAGLSGCGNQLASTTPAAPTTPATPASYPAVTGDWKFSAAGSVLSVAAGLTSQAGTVTGTATVYGCASQPETTTLIGSITTKGALKLTSGAVAGGAVLTIAGQLSADGKTAQNVTLTSSGSGCAIAATAAAQTLTGQVYAPAAGNYTGTFTGSDGVPTAVTATLSQGATAGPGGSYTLSGSVSFPNSPCLGTATINSATSTVTGGALSATYNATVSGVPVTITATGTADVTATNITITNWVISGGECDSYSGTGALSD